MQIITCINTSNLFHLSFFPSSHLPYTTELGLAEKYPIALDCSSVLARAERFRKDPILPDSIRFVVDLLRRS